MKPKFLREKFALVSPLSPVFSPMGERARVREKSRVWPISCMTVLTMSYRLHHIQLKTLIGQIDITRYAVLLAFLVTFVAAFPARAQTVVADESILDNRLVEIQAKRGLDMLYNMQFEEANVLFSQIAERHPNHPVGPFLKALTVWWKILLDLSDTSHDAEFYAAMELVVERSERLLERDPGNFDARFFKGAALGFTGRLHSNRGEWFSAAMDGKDAMGYVLGVAEANPENDDFVFGKGIYDYYAALVPERYPFARPLMWLFPEGSKERGLRLLERCAREGYYLQTEAVYFLLQIYYVYEDYFEKSVEKVSWLREHHPRNPFFHTFEGRVYARWGYWRRAEDIFSEVLRRREAGWTGYNDAMTEQALYYLGRAALFNNDYRQALEYLLRLERLALRTSKDTYFKVLGRLRQGMAYDALGEREQAIARYRQVLRMEEWSGSHRRARRYLEDAYGG